MLDFGGRCLTAAAMFDGWQKKALSSPGASVDVVLSLPGLVCGCDTDGRTRAGWRVFCHYGAYVAFWSLYLRVPWTSRGTFTFPLPSMLRLLSWRHCGRYTAISSRIWPSPFSGAFWRAARVARRSVISLIAVAKSVRRGGCAYFTSRAWVKPSCAVICNRVRGARHMVISVTGSPPSSTPARRYISLIHYYSGPVVCLISFVCFLHSLRRRAGRGCRRDVLVETRVGRMTFCTVRGWYGARWQLPISRLIILGSWRH